MKKSVLALAGAMAAALAGGTAVACVNDGTPGACHCLERIAGLPQNATLATESAQVGVAASAQTVHVFDFDFSTNPSGGMVMDAVIHVGDTVHWSWDSGFHSVTSVRGSLETFDSGDLVGPGGTFDHTFTHAGTFTYYCNIHGFDNGNGTASGMFGTITVLAVPEPASMTLALAGSVLLLRRRRRA